ncbi:ABC transporter transmembrane domain-containing protein [Nonomuraea recticatena]|uniref:ABC transporter transmembrane domain-containing protein n=1 Tax=Nonomuraea recticatena TaxID=46178 RepID=UPI0036166FFA
MNPSIRWLAGAVGGHRTAFLSTLAANLTSQLALWGIALSCAWLVGHGSLTAGVPAALVLLATAAAWWESYVAHDLAYLVLARLRGQAYEAIARIAPARLLGRRSGDLSAVVLSDIETLEWLFAHTLAQLITSFVVLTAGTVAAFLINPWLPLVTLPLACLVLTVPLWLRRFSSRHGSAMRAATADLHADVVDTVQGLREILAFGAVDRRRALLADKTRRLARAQTANAARGGLEAALTDVLLSTAAAASLAVVALTVSSPADAPSPWSSRRARSHPQRRWRCCSRSTARCAPQPTGSTPWSPPPRTSPPRGRPGPSLATWSSRTSASATRPKAPRC